MHWLWGENMVTWSCAHLSVYHNAELAFTTHQSRFWLLGNITIQFNAIYRNVGSKVWDTARSPSSWEGKKWGWEREEVGVNSSKPVRVNHSSSENRGGISHLSRQCRIKEQWRLEVTGSEVWRNKVEVWDLYTAEREGGEVKGGKQAAATSVQVHRPYILMDASGVLRYLQCSITIGPRRFEVLGHHPCFPCVLYKVTPP